MVPPSLSPKNAVEVSAKQAALVDQLRSFGDVIVALSGGVDSAVVAQAAWLALGERAQAATGVSASLPAGEADAAAAIAAHIGIAHQFIETQELADPNYVANRTDRCYHCKTELYGQFALLSQHFPGRVIANGANADDLGDYRPGMLAAQQYSVRSPLIECGFGKADVRDLARAWGLAVWDKPASPCLSSRIAYGQSVSHERLRMVDEAEQFLRGLGMPVVRVRWHEGALARIEVPLAQLPLLADPSLRESVERRLRELGFRHITLDLAGFRSGSLNEGLTLASIELLPPGRENR